MFASVRIHKKNAISVAFSGIAVTLSDDRITQLFNLNFTETLICKISKRSDAAQVLKQCKLIVWDKVTRADKGGIEALDRTLQDNRSSNHLMEGMPFLLARDFKQSLHVVPREIRADKIRTSLKSSYLWPKIQVKSLRVNMRVQLNGSNLEIEDFSNLLLQMENGDLYEDDE